MSKPKPPKMADEPGTLMTCTGACGLPKPKTEQNFEIYWSHEKWYWRRECRICHSTARRARETGRPVTQVAEIAVNPQLPRSVRKVAQAELDHMQGQRLARARRADRKALPGQQTAVKAPRRVKDLEERLWDAIREGTPSDLAVLAVEMTGNPDVARLDNDAIRSAKMQLRHKREEVGSLLNVLAKIESERKTRSEQSEKTESDGHPGVGHAEEKGV